MPLPFHSANMDPGNPGHATFPLSTNLQLQPIAFPPEMTAPDDPVMRPPSMHLDGVMPGLEDASTTFGLSQLCRLPNPADHHVGASAPPPFPIPPVNGFHLGNFKDGGYMMQPQPAAAGGFQPVMIDGFYPVQPQPLPVEATHGMESVSRRRTQRMIKNRESAARSRARRQASIRGSGKAYTSQLEAEIKDLKGKNEMLKENLKILEDDALIHPEEEKKPKLRTCSSAEF